MFVCISGPLVKPFFSATNSSVIIINYILLIFTAVKFWDWTMGSTATLKFANFNENFSRSVHPIVISILDDSVHENTECLICSIQAGVVQSVRIVAPEQVTICINDNEGKKGCRK